MCFAYHHQLLLFYLRGKHAACIEMHLPVKQFQQHAVRNLSHTAEGDAVQRTYNSHIGFNALSDLSDFNSTLAQLLTLGHKLTKLAPAV